MHQNLGVSLIEMLISLLILSMLLLGFDAMQIAALKATQAEYYFAIAAAQQRAMVERLKMLKNIPYDAQFKIWNRQNQLLLPQAIGVIYGNYPNFTLAISWGGKKRCNKNQLGKRGCIKTSIKI